MHPYNAGRYFWALSTGCRRQLNKKPLTLPMVTDATPSLWEGLRAMTPLPSAAPEPQIPQGAYGPGETESPLAVSASAPKGSPVELLAPAGGLEAAFAAYHFGADAVYLGLKKFSARAEAENFTLEELDEITAYAHHLTPRRRVFVTINTVIRQDELAELVEALAALDEIGVDAVILQDLGVYRALRRHFPRLELHGSTQMAVHNGAGARILQRLGFQRVVLARELTFEEVQDVTAAGGVETEVFIHGALCYAYSGLCLFSAQTLGRSGNRGKCAYSCRDTFEVTGAPMTLRDGSPVRRDPGQGFPFSMKDLALPDHLPALRAAGVSCFKIEGRKKSPLYVATTTDYYRRLLDGTLESGERPEVEADLQTVFSRPWTRLFVQSHTDKEVADRDTVGHRGTPVGNVQTIVPGREPRLRFHTRRPLQKHDGLQIDLPVLGKPFGFAVERLWLVGTGRGKPREVFEVPAETLVEVSLPHEHPALPRGAPVYCSSSQAVKQKYQYTRPKQGLWHGVKPLHIEAALADGQLTVHATSEDAAATRSVAVAFEPANDPATLEEAVRSCFARLGQSRFTLASLRWKNPRRAFVAASLLNRLRRELVGALDTSLRQSREARVAAVLRDVLPPSGLPRERIGFRWSIKVDRVGFLDRFEDADWLDIDEVIIDIARDHPALLREHIEEIATRIGRERIRLALPALTREWERRGLAHKIETLRAVGWKKWEAANLSAWDDLGIDPTAPVTDIDLATDWSVYVINRLAAQQVLEMGATRFALSPEDGLANWRSLLAEFGPRAVLIVHQDTPLFIAESCAYANLIGGCPGKANCRFESMEMESSHGEQVTALDYHCRTIVLNRGPFCLSNRLPELARAGAISLRADFVYRHYDAAEVRDRWRRVRAGKAVAGGHAANCDRGIL
jgi:putative protease